MALVEGYEIGEQVEIEARQTVWNGKDINASVYRIVIELTGRFLSLLGSRA